jgi:hypothetical protein
MYLINRSKLNNKNPIEVQVDIYLFQAIWGSIHLDLSGYTNILPVVAYFEAHFANLGAFWPFVPLETKFSIARILLLKGLLIRGFSVIILYRIHEQLNIFYLRWNYTLPRFINRKSHTLLYWSWHDSKKLWTWWRMCHVCRFSGLLLRILFLNFINVSKVATLLNNSTILKITIAKLRLYKDYKDFLKKSGVE